MNAMVETTNHSQVIAEIKTSFNLLLYSLSHVTPATEPISTPTPVLSPHLLPPSNPTTHPIPKPTPSARYPIKYLSYSEMQTRRDHGLCLNCDERYAPAHHCQTKRILVVLPDEDYLNLKSHPPVLTKLADLELNNEQETSYPALTGATNLISSSTISNDDLKTFARLSNLDSLELSDPWLFTDKEIAYHAPIGANNPKAMWPFISILGQPAAALVYSDDGIKIQFGCQTAFAMIEQHDHKLFAILLERDAKKIFEMKVFVFDPGGTLRVARVFDLEDKVDLEGVGNDTTILMRPPVTHQHRKIAHTNTRPRRVIQVPQRYLD